MTGKQQRKFVTELEKISQLQKQKEDAIDMLLGSLGEDLLEELGRAINSVLARRRRNKEGR